MLRYDSFRLDRTNLSPDENGFLTINKAYPTKAGVLSYRNADGTITKELRHPDEVFKQDSLASLALKPFSIEHRGGLLDPNTVGIESAGSVGENIGQEGNYVTCSIGVHRKDAIDKIMNGEAVELSAGYTCEIDKTSGIYDGHPYDQKQVNIRYNHLTLTKTARADGCRIRLDSGDAILAEETAINSNSNEVAIMKVIEKQIPARQVGEFRLDSEKLTVPEDQVNVVDTLQAREELLVEEMQKISAKLDSLASDNAKIKEQVKGFEGYIPASEIKEKVQERAELLSIAKEFKLDSAEDMDNKAIKKAVVAKVGSHNAERLDNESAYLDAAFDMAKAGMKKGDNAKKIDPLVAYDVDSASLEEAKLKSQLN